MRQIRAREGGAVWRREPKNLGTNKRTNKGDGWLGTNWDKPTHLAIIYCEESSASPDHRRARVLPDRLKTMKPPTTRTLQATLRRASTICPEPEFFSLPPTTRKRRAADTAKPTAAAILRRATPMVPAKVQPLWSSASAAKAPRKRRMR